MPMIWRSNTLPVPVLVLVRRGEPPNDSELGMPADQAPLDPGIAATIKSTPMEVPPKGCRGR